MFNLYVRETHVNKTENLMIGESEVYESWTSSPGQLFRALQNEFGRCTSSMFVDKPDGTAQKIGWVFEKIESYYDMPREKYLKETWVSVYEKPSTTRTTHHYYELA